MGIVFDVDALAKLAHWDLLDALPEQFGCPVSGFSTLSSLSHRARRAADGHQDRLFASRQVAERLARFVAGFSPLTKVDEAHVAALLEIPRIDPGEAVLVASAIAGSATLVTGDKRAIVALAANAPGTAAALAGRVVCLERIIRDAIRLRGLEWVQPRIARALTLDKAIHACMGSLGNAPLDAVLEGLTSYENALRSLTGSLLQQPRDSG